MNTRSRVVLALSAGCLFFLVFRTYAPLMFDAAAMQAPETADSTALPDAYGLDRLEDIADEEWLPAVEVSSAAVG